MIYGFFTSILLPRLFFQKIAFFMLKIKKNRNEEDENLDNIFQN